MCGVAGMIDLQGQRPVPTQALRAMAGSLAHRGSDEEGFLIRPGLGLASRRLSVVGLLDGRQPQSNETQEVFVVYNGELFDFPELRSELEARGHTFRTHCDTELLPHLWEEYGEGLFERLRGQFAFALWDERGQRLVLARDRFGICPLHWAQLDGWLLFASEVGALFASGMVAARPDPRGIGQLFTFVGVPGPVTCFEGVHSLLPGRFLSIVRSGGAAGPARVEERTWWKIDFPDDGHEEAGHDVRRLLDEFEAVLYRAVVRRLRAEVPVASYLSGGVDSGIVVAMASKALGSPIPTFTAQVCDPLLDETADAAVSARHVGARPVVVSFDGHDLVSAYPEVVHAAEAPVIDTATGANLALARRVRDEGFKVVLNGTGADEWLAGYPWLAATPFIRWLGRLGGPALVGRAIRLHLRWLGAPPQTYELVRRAEQALGGPNAWLIWTTLLSMSQLRLFSAQMRERLTGYDPFADLGLDADRLRRWHPLHRALSVGARTLLDGMVLSSKGDRVGMRASVEARYPFLDEDLFAFLARLHPRWKLHGFTAKYLLRKLAERWLPRRIAWRRKAMFRAPLATLYGPSAPAWVGQLLSPESLRRTGYFDPAAVGHWRRQYLTLRANGIARLAAEMGLVGVVATQLWHHLFIDASLAEVPSFLDGPSHRSHFSPDTGSW
jgi:asparagine synthase (glutamine-hydrolysing)